MPGTPLPLRNPSSLMLSRMDGRMSFLYLDRCHVHRDDNGTIAFKVDTDGTTLATQIPTATLTAILLGPGTCISQPAAAHASSSGCAVSFVGMGAVRAYGAFLSPYQPTERLVRQAEIVSDPAQRLKAAHRMFALRFPGDMRDPATRADINRLRGIEGIRMRGIYQSNARRVGVKRWRRNTGTDPSLGPPDSINRALNAANSALYGVVNSIILALGMSPGLGVIHTGNRQSFTLDIADLYKADITIPASFSLRDSPDPESDALRALRGNLTLVRLIPRIVSDIDEILGLEGHSEPDDEWTSSPLKVWTPTGEVGANWSHAGWWDS